LNFLMESEYMGNATPGPGNYEIMSRSSKDVKKVNLKPADWIRNHSSNEKRMKERSGKAPDPASYNPLPANFKTFGRMMANGEGKGKGTAKSGYFGSQIKFFGTFEWNNKSLMRVSTPGPGHYELKNKWFPGRESKEKKKPTDLLKSLSHYPTKSIYYDN